MSKLTDAIAEPAPKRCSVGRAIEQLDDESAKDFDAWMAGNFPLTDMQVWRGLQILGFRVGKQTVGRHRRQAGECGCSE
jgi:hypothetical protein